MKKYVVYAVFALALISTKIVAQPNDRKHEPMGNVAASLKIAFITKEVDLTTEEAEKFWPIYKKYFEEIKALRQEWMENKQDPLAFEEKALAVRKNYKEQFKKVLGSDERANKIFIAEHKFMRMIKQEMQRRRGEKPESPMP